MFLFKNNEKIFVLSKFFHTSAKLQQKKAFMFKKN